MKPVLRLVPQPAMAWRFVAGCGLWLGAALGLAALVAGPGVAGGAEVARAMLTPAVVWAAAVTGGLWLGGLVLGGALALALAVLSSRRGGWLLAAPGLALEWVALLPAWLLPWWLARESLRERLPLPGLWRSWGMDEDQAAVADVAGAATVDLTPWLVMALVALVVAGVTVGRMRHALLRARRRLAESAPLAARGLAPAAVEYRHRLGGAAPAIIHGMRDALPWSLLMLLTAGVVLQGPGLTAWLTAWEVAPEDGGARGWTPGLLAAWLWLGWLWCLFTGIGAWGERVAGGVPMVVASLRRPHGTLLGLETGGWTRVAWAAPIAAVAVAAWWLGRTGTPGAAAAAAGLAALLTWVVSVGLVSGRAGRRSLWLAYLARGGGHWPWWVAALMWTWGFGMPWWQGLLLPLAGGLLEGTSRARQLASFWVRPGGVGESAEVLGVSARQFRRQHLLPALGLAMLPWMLARVALLLPGTVALQAAQWLPESLAGGEGSPAFPFGWDELAAWAWPLATAALCFRVSCRLWERGRWRLAHRRRPAA